MKHSVRAVLIGTLLVSAPYGGFGAWGWRESARAGWLDRASVGVFGRTLGAQVPFTVPVIPAERYTLPNGLTVLLSEDHSAPVVAVDVWYHVGSKNERPGRTGFAHLFEHIMFQGSEHVPYGVHIKTIENAGGWFNGSTANDQTNDFQVLPSHQLETAFWLESDRMGFLLSALNQAKFDAQRDVVKNERRQRVDNQTYGSADEVVSAALYPPDNPYSWPVIGSMADLSAASLEDVKNFFRTYYVPNNAMLAVVGDFDPAQAKVMITKYFGAIPSGAPVTRPTVPAVTLPAEKRLVLEDAKGELPALMIAWPTVGEDHPDAIALRALGTLLTQDRTSRLTKLLVYDRQLATDVDAGQESYENAGQFQLSVTPRPTASLTEIERLVDSTLAELATTPPTEREIERIKNYVRVNSTIGLDGSFHKAEILLDGETFHHDPLYYVKQTNAQLALTPNDVARVAQRYLTAGRVVLSMVPAGKLDLIAKPQAAYTNVTPKPEAQTATPTPASSLPASTPASTSTPSTFDRSALPPTPPAKQLTFPKAQSRTLRNGIPIIVLEDHHAPVVSVVAVVDVPAALDPSGKTGLSEMVRTMLQEGTTRHDANQLADAFAELGNTVSPFGFYTIDANVDKSLELMAEQLLHPAFPDSALTRLKANTVADLRQEKQDPGYLSNRVLQSVVNGKTHPYARTQTETETISITRDDILNCYITYFRPPNVTFVVAGDVTPEHAVQQLNRVFGEWTAGKSARVDIPIPAGVAATTVYLYDRPQSPQSVIAIGAVGPRRDISEFFAIQLMNTTLGGAFTSRLNLNLREQHQYTYGARTGFQFRRIPEVGTFRATAAVATPKTDSALIETMKELRGIRDAHPVTPEEFAFAKTVATTKLPLQFETIRQRADAVANLVQNRLSLDYYNTLVAKFEAVSLSQVRGAAARYIDPSKLAIVIVGDRAAIEAKLRSAGIAPVVIVDPLL